MSHHTNDEPTRGKTGRFRSRHSAGHSEIPTPHASSRRTRYVRDGQLIPAPQQATVADALQFAQAGPNHIALSLFPTPSEIDIAELAEAWQLHPLLIEDLQRGGQRPKLERYDDVLFIVVRSARYIDNPEDVDFFEFHVLVRPNAIAILCQDGRWIDGSDETTLPDNSVDTVSRGDATLLADPQLLRLGPEAVLYRLLDAIVDGYIPVLRGIAIDKEQIERQVFSGDAAVAERIYRLSQEVIDLQHAASSLAEVVSALSRGFARYSIPESLKAYLQDVSDHLTRVETRVLELREALAQILSVNATLVAQRQNEDMKKISGWAAILFAPTLIGAIYGMNFDVMPELHWSYGYPIAVGAMFGLAALLYVVFKRKKWM